MAGVAGYYKHALPSEALQRQSTLSPQRPGQLRFGRPLLYFLGTWITSSLSKCEEKENILRML